MDSFSSYNYPRIAALLIAVAALVLSAVYAPHAEAGGIVIVKSADLKPYRDVLRGFQDACNCRVEELQLRGREDHGKILQKSPNAVVAIGTSVFRQVRDLKDIPVIYTMAMPSEVTGSLRPNISGVSMDLSPETYLDTMGSVFPRADRIGILYDPQHTAAFVEDAVKAAHAAGRELVIKQVHDASKIPAALDEMQGKIDILWMLPDPTIANDETVELLLRFSFQQTVPVFSFSKKYVEMGAVASLDVDPYDMGVQAAEIVHKLLTTGPRTIRVYARKSRLFLNKSVAAKMGLTLKDEALK